MRTYYPTSHSEFVKSSLSLQLSPSLSQFSSFLNTVKISYPISFTPRLDFSLDLLEVFRWEKSCHASCFKPISQSVSSVPQSCPTLCTPMNRSTPGLPVHHQLLEFTQTHVHRVSDAIQPSHPLSSPSPPAPSPSQHQGLFQWVNSSHEVAKVLEFQFQYQSFQWTPRTDLL